MNKQSIFCDDMLDPSAAEIFTARRGAVIIIVVKLVSFSATVNDINIIPYTVPMPSLTEIHS